MTNSPTLRGLLENESMFRKYNEQVNKGLDREIKKENKLKGSSNVNNLDEPLHFYCECSDEDCHERIVMKPSLYGKIHKNRKRFIVIPDHNVVTIEKRISVNKKYVVVEKYEKPPENPLQLNETTIDNSSD
jgi:hypothetical protein